MGRDCSETSASIRTVPRRMKLPNFGWMTLRWMPIWPRPAATATGLCETTQILPGKRSISIGKPIDGLTARTPSASRAATIARATSLVRSPGVVELQVGDRPGRAADRLPVHPADDADQPLGPRVEAEDLGPLVVELGPVDGDEADVVGPGVEAEPPEPLGVQDRVRRPLRATCRCRTTVGWSSSFDIVRIPE